LTAKYCLDQIVTRMPAKRRKSCAHGQITVDVYDFG